LGTNTGNIFVAGYHAYGDPMQIESDPSAPSDEWRVHLGVDDLDESTTVSAEDIADLEYAAGNGQGEFDVTAGAIWPTTYAGFSAAIKARCRWAWANRP